MIKLAYKENDVIAQVDGKIDIIHDLYEHYSKSFRKAVNSVMSDEYEELTDRFRLNVSRFAAYKAYTVTKKLNAIYTDSNISDNKGATKQALKIFNKWQHTEYNTAVARARTAKQFTEFMQPERVQMFPNLRWLPSRSADPRVSHTVFYNRVWAKNDPFWNNNAPGTEWNCKCDLEEVAGEPTDNSDVKTPPPIRGLEGRPDKTKQIFTDNASYIRNAGNKAIDSVAKCYYKDTKSKLQINVLAQTKEFEDNIKLGRILAKNKNVKSVAMRPHFADQTVVSIPNPEFQINGLIADAKRIKSWNVAASFRSAIGQNSKIVVIDLAKLEEYKLQANLLAIRISNRHVDFTTGVIDSCYVAWKGKSVKIDSSVLSGYTLDTKVRYIRRIEKLLDELVK